MRVPCAPTFTADYRARGSRHDHACAREIFTGDESAARERATPVFISAKKDARSDWVWRKCRATSPRDHSRKSTHDDECGSLVPRGEHGPEHDLAPDDCPQAAKQSR